MIDQREAISEKAVLIGVITQQQDETKSTEYLDELRVFNRNCWRIAVKTLCSKDGETKP